MKTYDLSEGELRTINEYLQSANENETNWQIERPEGAHAIAVGLNAPIEVTINGSTGYYCAGMNKHATIKVCLLYTSPSPRDRG